MRSDRCGVPRTATRTGAGLRVPSAAPPTHFTPRRCTPHPAGGVRSPPAGCAVDPRVRTQRAVPAHVAGDVRELPTVCAAEVDCVTGSVQPGRTVLPWLTRWPRAGAGGRGRRGRGGG